MCVSESRAHPTSGPAVWEPAAHDSVAAAVWNRVYAVISGAFSRTYRSAASLQRLLLSPQISASRA